MHIAPETIECANLAIPLVFGEVLHFVSERRVFGEVEFPGSRRSEEHLRVAHLMSAVRFPTRALALACVAAALHMAVAIVGLRAFPNSLFLHLCQRWPAVAFLWGVGVIALLAENVNANRQLFRQEHNGKCTAILHDGRRQDWQMGAEALSAACAGVRSRQLETVVIGWFLVYTAMAIALVSAPS